MKPLCYVYINGKYIKYTTIQTLFKPFSGIGDRDFFMIYVGSFHWIHQCTDKSHEQIV